ncbi:MAG: hypothetical protein K2L89_00535, partial [Muribaculaceae bacterium]|nr:hypothetical protein [Muribaculaceae bacterium]
MKKLFLSLLTGFGALTGVAQTYDAPLALHEGTQTIPYQSSIYCTYEAAEDQLVTIEGIASMIYLSDSSGADVSEAYNSSLKTNVFLIPANDKYKFYFYPSSTEDITVTVTTKPQTFTKAQTPGTAVTATAEPFFVPFIKTGGYMSPATPVYIKYTAPQDGKLTMLFDTTVSNLKFAEGGSSEYTDITNGKSVTGGWQATLQVDADTEYIFSGTASNGMMATFNTGEINPGANCDDALKMKEGDNALPEAEGSYWFSFKTPTTPESCFAILTSEADLTGGGATVYPSCGSSNTIVQDNELHLRLNYSANTERILEIRKATALTAPSTVNLSFEMVKPYDAYETAPDIEADQTTTTPDFGGTYYYAITAPQTGNYFLDVTTSQANIPAGTSVILYEAPNDYMSVANGNSSLRYNVKAGKKYIIKWSCPNNLRSLPFTATFTEVQKGETAGDPFDAVIGENNIPASPDVFFLYTAAENSWLVLTPSEAALEPTIGTVSAPGEYASSCKVFKEDGAYRFEGVKDQKYQIEFKNVADAATFTLATKAFAPGETAASPIIATPGETSIPDTPTTTYVRYTAEEDGLVDVSSTATYVSGNSIKIFNGVDVTINDYKLLTTSGNAFESMTFDLKEGDILTAVVTMATAQNNAVIAFTPRDPYPGEVPATAIEIDFTDSPMQYNFDKTVGYSDDPVWYSINLTGEIFNLEGDRSFNMFMYSEDNTADYIAQSTGNYYGPSKIENAMVPAPGKYYLKLTSSSAAFTATLSQRNAEEGETPATAYEIKPDEVPYSYTIEADYSSPANLWYAIKLQ